MRLVLLLFSCLALATPQTTRRIDFPAEKFSIAIPESWREIDSATLAIMSAAIPRAPGIPEFKIRHGYTAQVAPPIFPWVAPIRQAQLNTVSYGFR